MKLRKYYISTSKGLTSYLEKELQHYKIKIIGNFNFGFLVSMNESELPNYLFHSKFSSRIYLQLGTDVASNPKDVYSVGNSLPWENILRGTSTFKITTTQFRSTLFKNTLFASQLLKDAIVDRMRQKTGQRPNVRKVDQDFDFLLTVNPKDKHSSYIDIFVSLTKSPIGHRGYRSEIGAAPLKETLAAGILAEINSDPNIKLIDPMCGSGTFLIEEAIRRLKLPTSYLHILGDPNFWTLLRLPEFKSKEFKQIWDKSLKQNKENIKNILSRNSKIMILGSDSSSKAIFSSKTNIRKAKLENFIYVKQEDVLQENSWSNQSDAIFVCNPPYGERLGEVEDLKKIYYALGEKFKNNTKNSTAYIFTSNPELRKSISLKTSKRVPFFNGRIECRLLEYSIY